MKSSLFTIREGGLASWGIRLATAALAIAVVAFAHASALSRVYSSKYRAYVDPNQEMVGLGMANVAAGFFQGFPISGSTSRTPVALASIASFLTTSMQPLMMSVQYDIWAAPSLRQGPKMSMRMSLPPPSMMMVHV